MKNFTNNQRLFEVVFFSTSILLAIVVLFDYLFFEYFLKILIMSSLGFLYYLKSLNKSKVFLFSLFFATLSNLFFTSNDLFYLTIGLIAYLLYRLLTIMIVIKATKVFYLVSFSLGTLLFITPLFYFIILSQESFEQSLIPAITKVVLISILGGLSVSNYFMEEGVKNTWLLISTTLFAFLAVIFIIQKYYLFVPILESIRVIVFMGAHYIFYRYMLLIEIKQ